jgi:alkanesulfonate monooxygenase SsuD/methylene tetrahydromethanopterin reductase-like flavin-dependent oxidoreductase (luciferase family)
MRFGANLPTMSIAGEQHSLERLLTFVETAEDLGYSALGIPDHLVYPMIDPLTAAAAVLPKMRRMELVTSVVLAVVRGPVATAKALTALDILSGGRVTAGIGPGSSPVDYTAVGIPWEERWRRVDECMQAMRAMMTPGAEPFVGDFYSTEGFELRPAPPRETGIPLWFGTWGSDAGLRRVVKYADGWLASASHTDPATFGEAWERIKHGLAEADRDAARFPNSISTMYLCITESEAEAERAIERIAVSAHRPVESLREILPVGPPEHCAAVLNAYAKAGAQRVFVHPVGEPLEQIRLFMERVVPLVDAAER